MTDKTIDTLVEDVYAVLEEGHEDVSTAFGRAMGDVLTSRLRIESEPRRGNGVWFSNVGGPCPRKLWYKIHVGDQGEPLRPATRLKFLYGDLLEGLLLDLAGKSGHVVQHEQERVEWNGISGRIDAVIDGVLCDVKSASSFSFKKFKGGLQREDDAFGYLGQLAGYLLAIREARPDIVIDRNRAAFFVIDKTTGGLVLDVHEFTDYELSEIGESLTQNKMLGEGDETPDRSFEPVEDGKSGNLKLGVNCSYCEFKHTCHPGLRTFLYSNGPRFLTQVERVPDVYELPAGELVPDE